MTTKAQWDRNVATADIFIYRSRRCRSLCLGLAAILEAPDDIILMVIGNSCCGNAELFLFVASHRLLNVYFDHVKQVLLHPKGKMFTPESPLYDKQRTFFCFYL